jgi:oxygen-independent coproporphyrinogen-3 oxidase
MNHASVASYFEALDAGRFPVERGFQYTDETDFRLTVLFQMLISLTVDRGLFAALTDVDVVEESAGIWQSLAELGWVTVTPSHVHVVGDGVFYTPLIQSLLARDRVSELRRTGFVRSE